MSGFGAARDAAIVRRFRTTTADVPITRDVRVGFVFGPRALRGTCGRAVPVIVTDAVGTQHTEARQFASARAIARFWVAQLNRSFARAGVATRTRVGAVTRLATEELRPRGPHPGAWLADLCDSRVALRGRAVPLECWCAATGVNCALVLVDWAMSRTRIEQGGWAGFAPQMPVREDDQLCFFPVAIADLRCALTAHTLAHEFGHLVGCTHDGEANLLAPYARGFAAPRRRTFSLMAAARSSERGRRLEWSRPAPGAMQWDFGDAAHDEASWLRVALPRLAQQRFLCHGECAGACTDLAP
jgi:hypothetical protein